MWKHQLMFEIFCQMPWIQNNVSDFFFIIGFDIPIYMDFIKRMYSYNIYLYVKHIAKHYASKESIQLFFF